MSSTADITGTTEVRFVENYLRPLAEATINYHNDYLKPISYMWNSYMSVTGGGSYSYFFDSFTGGFSQAPVSDGLSQDHYHRLVGSTVYTIGAMDNELYGTIESHTAELSRAAARKTIATETIDLRQSTSGTGGWVAE